MSELERLEKNLFMLEMADHWDSEDYRIADELRKRIKELKGNGKN